MSGGVTNNSGREKIQQLLMAVGSGQKEDTTHIEAVEYNWREPHYFSSEQIVRLDDFAKRVAAAVAKKFSGFCRSEFDVTIASTTQHFTDEFLRPPSGGDHADYYLSFGADPQHVCGLIGIPEQTAVIWARQLLGDCESEKGSGKTLSQLEESLLLDLTSALVEAFSAAYASVDLHLAGGMIRGEWPLDLDNTEKLCRISFAVRKTGSEDSSAAYFLIPCEKLEPAVGKSTQACDKFSANEISRAVLNHLQAMPVTITARFASTTLTFEEIINLQVDDILLLEKNVDQPAELIIDGRTVCHGWLAKCAGNYAVTIAAATVSDTA
jgi:flagellar motor switch protein FliM